MSHHNKLLTTFLRWRKIFLPTKNLKFFPPKFTLRNPVVQGIHKAWKQGYDVALVVIRLKELERIRTENVPSEYELVHDSLKSCVKQAVERHIPEQNMLILHDYYYDGLSLFLKVFDESHSLSQIETMVETMLNEVEGKIERSFPSIPPQFEAGYMFLEKNEEMTHKEIQRAYQQALAMAEKKVASDYNQMFYDISQIVEKKKIQLLAQPIVNLETKEIYAWELLTRGPKNTSYENPLHLFSVARQTSFLYPLELLVFEKALQQIHETGCKQTIFINFTPISLGYQSFTEDIKSLLGKYPHISPKQLIFEITERDDIDKIDHLLNNIKTLREIGIRIAIDDTGSGYASFNIISSILPDIIKIDRSVTQDIDKNKVKESMLKGLMLVAKETGSLVVAEGIEREKEAAVVAKNNVNFAQGYYFARPGKLQSIV